MFSDQELIDIEKSVEYTSPAPDLVRLLIREIKRLREDNKDSRLLALEKLRAQLGAELAEKHAALEVACHLLTHEAPQEEVLEKLPGLYATLSKPLGEAFLSQLQHYKNLYNEVNKSWAQNIKELAIMNSELFEYKRAVMKFRSFMGKLFLEEFVGAKNALAEIIILENK